MQITFLGTGTSQGVPVIACQCKVCQSEDPKDKRLRSSILVKHKNKTFIIDTGPDFRQQMLREKVYHLDFVLLTHEHKDHTAGLDDIRAFNFSQQEAMNVYANKRTCNAIRTEFAYAFDECKYPGVPKIKLHEINNQGFKVQGIFIQPIHVIHFKLPVIGFRIENMAYITDASSICEAEMEKLHNLDLLILNALGVKPHYSHFNLEEALDIVNQLQPKQAYFTHISHVMGLNDEVNETLPPSIQLAHDGLKVEI